MLFVDLVLNLFSSVHSRPMFQDEYIDNPSIRRLQLIGTPTVRPLFAKEGLIMVSDTVIGMISPTGDLIWRIQTRFPIRSMHIGKEVTNKNRVLCQTKTHGLYSYYLLDIEDGSLLRYETGIIGRNPYYTEFCGSQIYVHYGQFYDIISLEGMTISSNHKIDPDFLIYCAFDQNTEQRKLLHRHALHTVDMVSGLTTVDFWRLDNLIFTIEVSTNKSKQPLENASTATHHRNAGSLDGSVAMKSDDSISKTDTVDELAKLEISSSCTYQLYEFDLQSKELVVEAPQPIDCIKSDLLWSKTSISYHADAFVLTRVAGRQSCHRNEDFWPVECSTVKQREFRNEESITMVTDQGFVRYVSLSSSWTRYEILAQPRLALVYDDSGETHKRCLSDHARQKGECYASLRQTPHVIESEIVDASDIRQNYLTMFTGSLSLLLENVRKIFNPASIALKSISYERIVVLTECGSIISFWVDTDNMVTVHWSTKCGEYSGSVDMKKREDLILVQMRDRSIIWLNKNSGTRKYDTDALDNDTSLTCVINNRMIMDGSGSWRMYHENERLVATATPQHTEYRYTPLVFTSNSNVLERYINKNMVVVLKKKKSSLVVRAVDMKEGILLYHTILENSHVTSESPILVSENFFVVVYNQFNEGKTLSLLLVVELYLDRPEPTVVGFLKEFVSTISVPAGGLREKRTMIPIAATAVFILPLGFSTRSMGISITKNSVTPKSLIFVTHDMGILSINRDIVLSPRRTRSASSKENNTNDLKKRNNVLNYTVGTHSRFLNYTGDTGADAYLPPITPFLAFSGLDRVDHGLNLMDVRFVKFIPTDRESTSLMIALGRDIYISPVYTVQRFDELGSDFDWFLLTTSCLIVLLVMLVSNALVKRKEHRDRWA